MPVYETLVTNCYSVKIGRVCGGLLILDFRKTRRYTRYNIRERKVGGVCMNGKILEETKKHDLVVFVRPDCFKREKDEEGKTIGIRVSGFKSPDNKYYDAVIPFTNDEKIKIDIIKNSDKYTGYAAVKLMENSNVSLKNRKGKIDATLDAKAFCTFVRNKNRKKENENVITQYGRN